MVIFHFGGSDFEQLVDHALDCGFLESVGHLAEDGREVLQVDRLGFQVLVASQQRLYLTEGSV